MIFINLRAGLKRIGDDPFYKCQVLGYDADDTILRPLRIAIINSADCKLQPEPRIVLGISHFHVGLFGPACNRTIRWPATSEPWPIPILIALDQRECGNDALP